MKTLCALGVLCAVASWPVAAETHNAASILKACSTEPGGPTEICRAYINGVIAGVLVDQIAREQSDPICLPPSITTEQAINVVSAFIGARPGIWSKDGNAVVGVALQAAFPCK